MNAMNIDSSTTATLRCMYTVGLVIFARFQFSQISRGGQIREFKNFAKIIIMIALLKKNKKVANSKHRGTSPKSDIRENLNTRKLPDLQYILSGAAGNAVT